MATRRPPSNGLQQPARHDAADLLMFDRLSGAFTSCEFCVLTDEDREVLGSFRFARKHEGARATPGVSYPTASRD